MMSTSVPEKMARCLLNRTMVENKIANCDAGMVALQNTMTDMKFKRLALNTELNSTTPFLAVLPLEVICHIFELIVESQDTDDYHSLPPQFLLGRICKAWRDITWSTPRLWTLIVLRYTPARSRAQKQLLREWLIRSANHQLRYYLTTSEFELEVPQSFSDLIFETSTRWKVFHCFALQLSWKSGLEPSFPCLTSLGLSLQRNTVYDFSSAVQLRDANLYCLVSKNILINWHHLTTLSADFNIEETLFVIQALREIKSLFLNLPFGEVDTLSLTVPQKLASLSRLEIEADDVDHVSCLIRSITAPALTSLTIDVNSGAGEWCEELAAMHRRSSFNLTSLTLLDSDISEDRLIQVLQPFSSLSRLDISQARAGSGISDAIIDKLNPGYAGPGDCILPSLTQFDYSGNIKFESDNVLFMLEERLGWRNNLHTYESTFNKKAPIVEPLRSFNINYWNANYLREGDLKDPNNLQDFYRRVVDLESRGTALNLVWKVKV